MGGAEEPPETKQRGAVYERPSCKESVFRKMLTNEPALLCERYLKYDVVPATIFTDVL